MALTKIVKKLTENHREFLLSQTPRSTPDNPTESGWSASKIRQYQWQGFSTLFTLLDSVESRVIEYLNNTVTTAIDGNSGDIAILTTNISNEVLRATNAEQNLAISINNTLTSANGYTDTKFGTLNEKISNILSGELTAKKAEFDSYGRKIQTSLYYSNLSVSVDATTGLMYFKFYNAFGEVVNTVMADTNLERIASIFDYDETTKMLYVIDYKGDRHEIDLSSLIDTYIADNQGHDCIVTIENNGISVDLPTETKTDIAKGVTAYNKAINLEDSVVTLGTTKANKATTYTKDENDTLLAGKQDTLVSGENIKTINGTSLLGSGNYAFDTTLNETSTNAVQNKVITEYITDLESKVSTLAVKVYNHDIALGTLNIENVLYSVENADSFAIPTTIGTNADVVIPKSRMALSAVKGKTEYSRNLLILDDVAETTLNGVTYKIQNGAVYINGTARAWSRIVNKVFATPLENVYVKYFTTGTRTGTGGLRAWDVPGNNYYNFGSKFFGTGNNALKGIEVFCNSDDVYTNYTLSIMISATEPTEFVQGYTGLKNVELNSLNVYGKSETDLKNIEVGDIILRIFVANDKSVSARKMITFTDGTYLYAHNDGNYSYYDGSSYIPITDGYYDFSNVKVVSEFTTDTSKIPLIKANIKNATSVKSILPSSILPKTLASYERLEVVDNGDDTYKIDKVTKSNVITLNGSEDWNIGSPNNRYFVNNAAPNAMDNANGVSTYGGNLFEVTPQPTDRGVWIQSSSARVNVYSDIVNDVASFKTWLSNNPITILYETTEETRTTLIDGLSLDDVSAVIDTGDIIYADNSNAEYDVSIAETSVELLVNKAN